MDGKRLLGVILACAFAVSCGGGGATTTTTSAAPTGGAATAAPTSAGATAAATAAGGNQPKLADLLSASKASTYKITYKLTVTGSGMEGMSGEQSWYFKPPKARFDFSTNTGGQSLKISYFSLPDGQYYCFGGGGLPATCISLGATGVGSPLDQNQAASMQQSLIGHPDQYGATFTSSKTYAGMSGNCYDVKGTAAATAGLTTGTFCYSKDGIPLYSGFAVQGAAWAMEATSVSTTVPDSDFDLPAKPTKP